MNRTSGATTFDDTAIASAPARAAADPLVARLAAKALLAALLLGIVGDALLRTDEAGVNVPLWAVAAIAATAWLARERGTRVPRNAWVFALPVLFFAGAFAWRDAGPVLLFNVLAMLVGFGMLAFALGGWPPSLVGAKVFDYLIAAVSLGVSGMLGAPMLLVHDGGLAGRGGQSRRARAAATLRGVLIAVPILLVFGALLTSADARFERLVDGVFRVDLEVAFQHLVFAGFLAWVSAGWLRAALVARAPLGVNESTRDLSLPTLGIIELAVPLALLDLLFLAFVVLQLPYLFGGAAHVQQVAGLTVAEYARRGFFQLIVVAALVLPLVLAGSALVRAGEHGARRLFTWLAGAMLVLVAVMLVSAGQRMLLYTATFGLTEDRLIATTIMIWLALVLAIFAATGLRGRAAGFVLGAIVSGWLVVAALDLANPQAMIVRVNAERAARGEDFDAKYHASLGADAVPALAAATAKLNDGARCIVLQRLARTAADRDRGLPVDWRWWNASRTTAFRVARAAPSPATIPGCTVPTTP